MYLRGLADALPAVVASQANACTSGGGIPQFWYGRNNPSGSPILLSASYMGCDYPPSRGQVSSGGGSPVTISVPTNVTTQISPQVSPQFVQQEHPTNSPVDAAAIQEARQSVPINQPPDWLQTFMDALTQKPATDAGGSETTTQYIPGQAAATSEQAPVASGFSLAGTNPLLLLAAAGLLAMVIFSRKESRQGH